MRRTRLTLLVSAIWLVAALLACGILTAGLPAPPAFVMAGAALATAFAGSLLLGRRADAAFAATLGKLGQAVGLKDRESRSVEAIVANLCARLERAHQFKAAFTGLRRPAVLLSAEGEILGASAGLQELAPAAVEGATADALFGEGYLAGGGGVAEEGLVTVGGDRFETRRRSAGQGRTVLELIPAGHYIADDDLDAFAAALAGGHTSFRFDPAAVQRSVALRTLENAFARFDEGARALAQLLAGEDLDPVFLRSNSGFAPQVRALNDTLKLLIDERDEAVADRDRLEAKMEAILRAIDRYRAAVTSLAEHADASRAGLAVAGDAIARGRNKLGEVRTLQQNYGSRLSRDQLVALRVPERALAPLIQQALLTQVAQARGLVVTE
ncbi:MAG TPA: hypothetical protein GYA10_11025, partial [Alphaproteobacteria bacterium]|nr:hypothetical protein [Alphaproteobacteria bacterium]